MSDFEGALQAIEKRLQNPGTVASQQEAAQLQTAFFGRKAGLVPAAMSGLRTLPKEARAAGGKRLNELKKRAEGLVAELQGRLQGSTAASQQDIDASIPGTAPPRGTRHPLSLVRAELEEIFLEMGFAIADGPEVDDDFHCFGALNIPPDHPAREMQDTLYVGDDTILRPHTSSVQIRTMQTQKPPIRIIATGRCYRRDTPDLTHSPMFHQIEGLVVDEGITMADLKGTLEHLCRRQFSEETKIRLRPSFFPFTEPSAELDISCFACAAKGCNLCKQTGYIELCGCGMVDPNVFKAVGIDPERYTGFAFGLGIERLAMLKHGIDNIRLFFENDVRFLSQFPALS